MSFTKKIASDGAGGMSGFMDPLKNGVGISERTKIGILAEKQKRIDANPTSIETAETLVHSFKRLSRFNYNLAEIARRATNSLRDIGDDFSVPAEALKTIARETLTSEKINLVSKSLTETAAFYVTKHANQIAGNLEAENKKRLAKRGNHLSIIR